MDVIFKDIVKIGIVVNSVEDTARIYSESYGIGPWKIWNLTSEKISYARGTRPPQAKKAAAKIGKIEIELIDPLDFSGVFLEYLSETGEGVAYLVYQADDFPKAAKFMQLKGKSPVCEIRCNGVTTVFYDLRAELKHIVGIEKRVSEEGVPDEIFPKSELGTKCLFNSIFQIGIVVKDIDKTAATFSDEYGIGFWSFSHFNPSTVQDMKINETSQAHDFIVTTGMVGNVELEFMQAFDDKSIYAEFLKTHGEGIQHICMLVDNFEETLSTLRNKGQKIKQSGNWHGCEYLYMSSENDLKFSVELYDAIPDFKRPSPAYTYPVLCSADC